MIRRLCVAVLCTGVVALVFQETGLAQLPNDSRTPLSIHTASLAELRSWDAFVTQESRSGSLRLHSVIRDPLLPERIVERFEQFHNGVPIWGADVVRDSERGVPQSLFGEMAPADLQISAVPALSPEAARAAVLRLAGSDGRILRSPELTILRVDGYRLAYTAVFYGNGDVLRTFVDAATGAELMRYREIQRQAAVGTGRGVLGDTKKLSVQSNAGTFVAFDRLRPPVIETFDMRGNPVRFLNWMTGLLPFSMSDLANSSSNVWSDPAVVDGHVHVSWTYDYYFKRFGRHGLDGRDGPIDIVVNPLTQQGALTASDEDFSFALNAGWCGACGPAGRGAMYFGSGLPAGVALSNGQNITYFSGGLDVAAHELTHAVTSNTSDLEYVNESGALNEAFSDMMGKSVEFFYHPPGSAAGQADYVIGKDIARAVRPGALNGFRSMANPRQFGDPDHFSGYLHLPPTDEYDNGGVHLNSGIPNHAFYLAIEGGTNRTSGRTVQGVGAANREQIERVFYRAFTTLLPQTATFSVARIATIQAARDLYGIGSAPERAVTQAWDAVGVTNTSSSDLRLPTYFGTLPPTGASRFAYYAVTMPASGRYQAVLMWDDPAVDLDLMIGRPNCLSWSCMLTRADSVTRRPETVCLDVRSGEEYWVVLQNFGARPTPFDLTHSISPNASGPCAISGSAGTATADPRDPSKVQGAEPGVGERLN